MNELLELKQRTLRYILDRSCLKGGFCFYRLNEPNPHDTYFALATLNILATPCDEQQTIQYLQAVQHSDGRFESMAQAFFVLSSLKLLKTPPLHCPNDGIETLTNRLVDLLSNPSDTSVSLINGLHQLTKLRHVAQLD